MMILVAASLVPRVYALPKPCKRGRTLLTLYNYFQVQTLRVSLEDARANGDRLHRESELVVENVSSWVKEQK